MLNDQLMDYDALIAEELQVTQDEQVILENIMKKTRGLANPFVLKEAINHAKK